MQWKGDLSAVERRSECSGKAIATLMPNRERTGCRRTNEMWAEFMSRLLPPLLPTVHFSAAATASRSGIYDRSRAECVPPLTFELAQRVKSETFVSCFARSLSNTYLAVVSTYFDGKGVADSWS